MSGIDHLGLLRRIDALYESVVMVPERWTEDAFADWAAESTAGAVPTKEVARQIRRSLRAAQKLQQFWSEDIKRPPDGGDWRTRVDLALGPRAWRPTLEIAQLGLRDAPSEALFEEVRDRFRVVNSDRWMEEVTFTEWLADRGRRGMTPNGLEQ